MNDTCQADMHHIRKSSLGLSLEWVVYITPLLSKLRDLCEREMDGKIARPRGGGQLLENRIFQKQQAGYIYELTEAMTACIRPVQTQTRQNPNMGVRGGHEIPPEAEELLYLIATKRRS